MRRRVRLGGDFARERTCIEAEREQPRPFGVGIREAFHDRLRRADRPQQTPMRIDADAERHPESVLALGDEAAHAVRWIDADDHR
jgi:hypothetical protein